MGKKQSIPATWDDLGKLRTLGHATIYCGEYVADQQYKVYAGREGFDVRNRAVSR
jgi:hypothetical protein